MAAEAAGAVSSSEAMEKMTFSSVPAIFTVPAFTASGRSVSRRRTSTGRPRAGASSCSPPESVMTR